MSNLASMSPDELEKSLFTLLGDERATQLEFLRRLGEFDRRKLYRTRGYPSLWDYCVKWMKLTTGPAFCRITTCRLLRKFPILARYLADGRLCVTTVIHLRKVITDENAAGLFERAAGKSSLEVRAIAADVAPPKERPTLVRVLPATTPEALPPKPEASAAPEAVPPNVEGHPTPVVVERPAVRETSMGNRRTLVQLNVDGEFMALLEKARSVVSHSVPDGDVVAVIRRGLQKLVDDAGKKPLRVVKPREKSPDSRHIPASLERAVRERDRHCCAAKTATGVCGSTWQLEIDHVVPFAKGGATTLENLRLVCRRHNRMYADQTFGDGFIEAKIRDSSAAGSTG